MFRSSLFILLFAASTSFAGKVAEPGDIGLRHEIQVLADYGVISGPATSWPISWDALVADLQVAVDSKTIYPNAVERMLQRLISRANREVRRGDAEFNARASAAAKPTRIRGFSNTPREEGEVSAGVSWLGKHLSLDLNATGVIDPDDGEEFRADGSRVAVDMGNTTLAISTMDRWWGPGWDGSLILSNNARPMPAITFGRNRTHAFETKWLSWLGPWDLEMMMGQMEEEREIPNTLFFGMRFTFRPLQSLEIGLSRTAQWCGDDRPCDFDTFWNLLTGNDNVGDAGITPENEPGNQLAGLDVRWSNMWFGRPSAIYAQIIGEDEAGGLPSRSMVQLGIETSGFFRNHWSYRWYAELAGTSCDFSSDVIWNCAYNHGIYKTGYRYRGRVVGHGTENDSQIVSTGLVLVSERDQQWQALLRFGDLNRGGPSDVRNTLTPTPLEIASIDLTHSRSLGKYGWLDLGLGYEQIEDLLNNDDSSDVRGFVTWRSH
jgi:hypothetical protein